MRGQMIGGLIGGILGVIAGLVIVTKNGRHYSAKTDVTAPSISDLGVPR